MAVILYYALRAHATAGNVDLGQNVIAAIMVTVRVSMWGVSSLTEFYNFACYGYILERV
jgi:hypothetical protein